MSDIDQGYYSAVYFNRAAEITARVPREVTMQFFQRKEDTVLAGIPDFLNVVNGIPGRELLTVKTLNDGDVVQPWEPVVTIHGNYHLFARYESALLGILARCSRVATNMSRLVEAANGKPVFFFGDRFDIPEAQVYDGYAAVVGGASAVCTEAMHFGALLDAKKSVAAIGTMPHALIAFHDGDVVEACKGFRREFPEVDLHALVDFNNDSVGDSLRCLAEFGKDLKGVRLDTSGNMVDVSLTEWAYKDFDPKGFMGVNPRLVKNVREALDANGGQHVQITVSGGFNAEKIIAHEKANPSPDNYAAGSSVVTQNPIDFTADVVSPVAKVGRFLQDASRLTER